MEHLLSQIVQNSAEKAGTNIAFRYGDLQLSYRDLLNRSNQLANVLIEAGVSRGDRVGIYLGRCLETAVAIFGIMRAGAAYVPLDVSSPAARTKFLIKDCEIKCIVSAEMYGKKLSKALSGDSMLNLIVGTDQPDHATQITWSEVSKRSNQNPEVNLDNHDLAYIMYTSGTTGKPKGIMHTHFSGMSYARLSAQLYGLNHTDRISSHAPLHFDISTLAYFTGPLVGATSVIIPEAHTKMPVSLTQMVEREQLTVWYSAPLALTQMITHGLIEERDFSSLRLVLFGGEPMAPKYLRSLMEFCNHAKFCNVYGPAEVNQCTHYFIPEAPESDQPIPIGRVWSETKMMVVDETDAPINVGNRGELLISSSTMMKGYWNNPKLTSASLYVSKNGETYYRTGDLVHLEEGGLLQFLGRKDRQVKTRGYRVELEAVEFALLELDCVIDAAVFTTTKDSEGLLIEAAVILKEEEEASDGEIKSMLKDTLPAYAVPQEIHLVNSLPRTSTGKIDRQLIQSQTNNHNQ